MRNSLVKFSLGFLRRYRVTVILWLIIAVFGLFSYTTLLNREGFPAVQTPIAVVNGTYFVDDKIKVDQEAALPVTNTLLDIEEVVSVTSYARSDFFTLVVELRDDISSQRGVEIIRDEIERNNQLPEAADLSYQSIEAAKFNNEFDAIVSVYDTNGQSLDELLETANRVALELQADDAIREAEVEDVFAEGTNPITGETVERQTSFSRVGVRVDGENNFYNSVSIGLIKANGVDTIELSDATQLVLDDINQREDFSEVETIISADFADTIDSQVSSLQNNVLSGLLAVIVVSFLLISWRASLITAIFISSVLLGIFAFLYVFGFTLNTITLFALVLALGLFVDDATIIVEAIDANRGKKRFSKIAEFTLGRVALASLAGSLTTILVFTPMLFVSGILGEFIRQLPLTVIIALSISLVFSLALIPFLSSFILFKGRSEKSGGVLYKAEARVASAIASMPRLVKTNRRKGIWVGLGAVTLSVVALFAAFAIIGSSVKFNIFPASKDSDAIQISVDYPNGANLEQAQQISNEVDDVIERIIGDNLAKAAYIGANEQSATIQVELISYNEREITAPQLIELLNQEFTNISGVDVEATQIDGGPPESEYPFKVQVYSEDPTKARDAAQEITSFLEGATVTRPNGTEATITEAIVSDPTSLNRKDGELFVEAQAKFSEEDTSALVGAAQTLVEDEFGGRLESFGLQEDALEFDFGQESENASSFEATIVAFFIALALMYLLLVIQFNSLSQPLLIFMAIPFSLFGVAAGLALTDNAFSFFTMIGFTALIGIAVNNTILLTDYANQERAAGKDRVDAISEAVRLRFRPVVTTTLTTVAALVPLALTDPFWEALTVTIIFGLLSSTILVIVSFPYFYLALETIRDARNRRWPQLK